MAKKYYVRDLCDEEDVLEFDSLESVKELLYNAWIGFNEDGNGWSQDEIDNMNEDLTSEALEGIGYILQKM